MSTLFNFLTSRAILLLRQRRTPSRAACIVLSLLAGSISPSLHAQTAHLSGVQSVVPTSKLDIPYGVAVDGSGNIYIADTYNNRVLKETLSEGIYTESTIGSDLNAPAGIAVDGSGNVYVSTGSTDNRVLKETLSNGGYIQSTVASGLDSPIGIAVDGSGNVYIVETGNNKVVKETLSAGRYIQSIVPTSSLFFPRGVAVDGSGNVYVTDTDNNRVLKETLSVGNYTESTIVSGLNNPQGVAVDGSGNVYIADTYNKQVLKETLSAGSYIQSVVSANSLNYPSGIAVDKNGNIYIGDEGTNHVLKETMSSGDFGTVNVGSRSSSATLIFTFDTGGSIGNPAVVTQGVAGLDFADAGTGSCTTNGMSHTYSVGETCTVDVNFTPEVAGARHGAAVLNDSAGHAIATGYVQGAGSGPQVNFPPGTQSTLSFTNVTSPYAIATDVSGNLYIAQAVSSNNTANALFKETWNGSGYTQTTIATGFNYPVGVAVDGAGNVYVADQDNTKVTKWSPSGSGYTFTGSYTNLGNVESVAVDGSGNLYIGSLAYGLMLFPAGSSSPTFIARSLYTSGIAVDTQGVIYAADMANNRIVTETLSNGSYTQNTIASNLDGTHGVAVDINGNVYVANGFAGGGIVKLTPSGSNYSQTTLVGGINDPLGVALDAGGNIYASSPASGTVLKLDTTTPPSLTFPTTNSGSTSTAQTVTVANIGNAPLTFPIPSSGSNPSIPANFSLNGTSSAACPQVSATSSSVGTLAAGSTCQLSVSFAPASAGSITSSLILTDNNLNAAAPSYATQTIALSGTALMVPTLTFAAIPAQTYGVAPFTVSAASASSGAVTYSVASGPATISGSTVTITGAGTVVLNANQAVSGNYAAATATISFTVVPIIPTLTFAAIPSQTYGAAPFTVSATSASSGPVTYAVTSGPVTISGSTVTLTGSGTVVLNASQAPSGNYGAATATVSFTVAAESFAVAPPSTGSSSTTTTRGGTATFALSLTPATGTTFPNAITFTVSGLPTGSTATFSPATIAAGSGATLVTLTIQTSSQTARNENSPGTKFTPIALGILLLPLAGFKSARNHFKRASCLSCILAIAALSWGILMAGCSGGSSSGNNNGGGNSAPQTYTLVVTAKDAVTGAQNTTNLTLTVQ